MKNSDIVKNKWQIYEKEIWDRVQKFPEEIPFRKISNIKNYQLNLTNHSFNFGKNKKKDRTLNVRNISTLSRRYIYKLNIVSTIVFYNPLWNKILFILISIAAIDVRTTKHRRVN